MLGIDVGIAIIPPPIAGAIDGVDIDGIAPPPPPPIPIS